jgi:GntR family transcriptional regulator, rspAB operon transcriptional repressor
MPPVAGFSMTLVASGVANARQAVRRGGESLTGEMPTAQPKAAASRPLLDLPYTTLGSKVYDILKREIIACELAPGQVVFEKDLCRRLGVSKVTASAALMRLIQEGLIRSIPSVGYLVSDVTLEDVRDLCRMRVLLDKVAVEEAVEHATEEQLAHLGKFVDETDALLRQDPRLPDTQQERYELNTEFHLRLAEIASCRRFVNATHQVMEQMERLYYLAPEVDSNAGPLIYRHREIVAALRRRDARTALEIAVDDIEQGRAIVERALSQGGSTRASDNCEDSLPGPG